MLLVFTVERMLDYDPATRIKPMQALNHPFLREEEAQSPDAAAASAAPVGMCADCSLSFWLSCCFRRFARAGHTTRVSVSTLAMEADDNKSMLNAAVFASAIPSTGKSAAAPSSLPAVKRTGMRVCGCSVFACPAFAFLVNLRLTLFCLCHDPAGEVRGGFNVRIAAGNVLCHYFHTACLFRLATFRLLHHFQWLPPLLACLRSPSLQAPALQLRQLPNPLQVRSAVPSLRYNSDAKLCACIYMQAPPRCLPVCLQAVKSFTTALGWRTTFLPQVSINDPILLVLGGITEHLACVGTAVPLSLIATASLDPSAGSSGGTKPSAGVSCVVRSIPYRPQ